MIFFAICYFLFMSRKNAVSGIFFVSHFVLHFRGFSVFSVTRKTCHSRLANYMI